MLTTTIKEAEKYDYMTKRFQAAFAFLRETDFSQYTEPCEVPIEGRDVFAEVQIYETKPETECRFETHRVYYDIQYMAEGEEYMGFTPLRNLDYAGGTGYMEERDVAFYPRPEMYGRIYLREGDFAVVSPDDGHMPRCIGRERRTVKKVVVKVRVN